MGDGDQVMVLTGAGVAAIAIVRLRGHGVPAFLAKHFNRPLTDGRPVHGTLSGDAGPLDDPVVVTSQNGFVADINLHGGAWVVQSVIELARRAGFQIIKPVDQVWPAEAVDADSIIEQEVLTHLPLARTELGLRVLLAQLDAWKTPPSADEARRMLSDRSLWWLLHPPRVVIVGDANVGKSTLANQLFATERSITADLPGTTRDWVGDFADIDGLPVMLLDTPGLRATRDPIEAEAIRKAEEQITGADLVIAVIDATRPDLALLDRYPRAIHVSNKSDLAAAHPGAIATVATTRAGVPELRHAITRRFDCDEMELSRPRIWTRRQEEVVRNHRNT